MRKLLSLSLLISLSLASSPYGKYFGASKDVNQPQVQKQVQKSEKGQKGYIDSNLAKNDEIEIRLFNAPFKSILKTIALLNSDFHYVLNEGNALSSSSTNLLVQGGLEEVGQGQGSGQGQAQAQGQKKTLDWSIDNINLDFVFSGSLSDAIKTLCDQANVWCTYNAKTNLWEISKYKVFYVKLPIHFASSLSEGTQTQKVSFSLAYSKLLNSIKNLISDGDAYIDDLGNLVIVCRPKDYEKIKDVIKDLQSQKKVVLKIKLVRLDLNNEAQHGIDWNAFLDALSSKVSLSTIPDTLSSGINIAFNKKDFSAVLKALASYGKVKTVKEWKVKTMTNNLLTFSIVTQVPVITSSSTTTDTATQNSVNVDFKEVGLKLSILPYKIKDNLALDIYTSLSNVKDIIQLENSQIPVISQNDMYIPYVAKPNQMILLTLYSDNTESYTNQGFPILSKIPVLKTLFGYSDSKHTKTDLLLFIEPSFE